MKIFIFLFFAISFSAKIKIEAYTESLCPDCIEFETTSLLNALNTPGFSTMADVEIFPFGNAQEEESSKGKYVFSCQHGTVECLGNLYETCAKYLLPIEESHNFIICLSSKASDFKKKQKQTVEKCAASAESYSKIIDCSESNDGNKYQHLVAAKTDSLKPPHKWVPWIVVDGVHDEETENLIIDNMLKYVCDNYQGEKAPACNNINKIATTTNFVRKLKKCMRYI